MSEDRDVSRGRVVDRTYMGLEPRRTSPEACRRWADTLVACPSCFTYGWRVAILNVTPFRVQCATCRGAGYCSEEDEAAYTGTPASIDEWCPAKIPDTTARERQQRRRAAQKAEREAGENRTQKAPSASSTAS